MMMNSYTDRMATIPTVPPDARRPELDELGGRHATDISMNIAAI
jgi:hypothetical protein